MCTCIEDSRHFICTYNYDELLSSMEPANFPVLTISDLLLDNCKLYYTLSIWLSIHMAIHSFQIIIDEINPAYKGSRHLISQNQSKYFQIKMRKQSHKCKARIHGEAFCENGISKFFIASEKTYTLTETHTLTTASIQASSVPNNQIWPCVPADWSVCVKFAHERIFT